MRRQLAKARPTYGWEFMNFRQNGFKKLAGSVCPYIFFAQNTNIKHKASTVVSKQNKIK